MQKHYTKARPLVEFVHMWVAMYGRRMSSLTWSNIWMHVHIFESLQCEDSNVGDLQYYKVGSCCPEKQRLMHVRRQCVCVCVCVCVCESLSHVRLFATPWTIACQVRLSMAFSRQEYWSGLPFPSPVRRQRCGKSQPPFPQRSAKMQVYCRETRLYHRIGPTFWRDVLKNLDIMRKKSKVIHNWPCRNFFSLPWKTLTRVPTIFLKCISHHIIIVKTINSHF